MLQSADQPQYVPRSYLRGRVIHRCFATQRQNRRAQPSRRRVGGAKPAQGSIVKVESRRVWLNIGQGAVDVGDSLEVLAKGEELIDPETGISLGSEDTVAGRARVTDVREKFSIAQLDTAAGTIKRGDRVMSLVPPPTIEFADAWIPPEQPKRFKK